jgi:hypothetical protein
MDRPLACRETRVKEGLRIPSVLARTQGGPGL